MLLRDFFNKMAACIIMMQRPVACLHFQKNASHLARHFEIPIRHDDEEEMLLPTRYLDYNSMLGHDFISDDKDKRLIYNLVFSQKTCQIITLPAPSLFDIHSGRYLILPEDIYA